MFSFEVKFPGLLAVITPSVQHHALLYQQRVVVQSSGKEEHDEQDI